MFFADLMALDSPRRSGEGYVGVHAKSARSGVYQYLGKEIDPEGVHFRADQVVNVYRAPEEVFNAHALGSFVAKPITDDHPTQPVTAKNWRDLARGTIMGAVKEGDYVGFDLAFLDAGVIDAIDSGKRELSCGYTSEILIGDGVAPDGTTYQAQQVGIKGNHVALVDKGRAGSTCRVGDSAICEPMPSDEVRKLLADGQTYSNENSRTKNNPTNVARQSGDNRMHTLVIDQLQVTEVSDSAKLAIEKLQGQVKDAAARADKAEADLRTATETISTKDGEIAALEKKVEDAALKPDQLEKLVKDRSELIAQAKAVHADVVTDGKTDAEIRKAVVTAKLGDSAKDMDDAAISGAFKVLAKDIKVDPVREAISNGTQTVGDAKAEYEKARQAARQNISDGWKNPAPAEAA